MNYTPEVKRIKELEAEVERLRTVYDGAKEALKVERLRAERDTLRYENEVLKTTRIDYVELKADRDTLQRELQQKSNEVQSLEQRVNELEGALEQIAGPSNSSVAYDIARQALKNTEKEQG
jgi:predicted RNase H-like nuclease (RuvC/YqgF family)